MPYTRFAVLLDPSTSDVTGGPFFIGDFTQLTLSRISQIAGASNLTVQVSNSDGFTAALAADDFSHVTALAAQGAFGVETGPRWIRVLRKSASSETIAISGLVNR